MAILPTTGVHSRLMKKLFLSLLAVREMKSEFFTFASTLFAHTIRDKLKTFSHKNQYYETEFV